MLHRALAVVVLNLSRCRTSLCREKSDYSESNCVRNKTVTSDSIEKVTLNAFFNELEMYSPLI